MNSITGTLRGGALIRKQESWYTPEQTKQYLDRVRWKEGSYSVEDIAEGRFPANLENLAILMKRHLISFPNDTTPMHFSPEHFLDVSPEATFKRLVVDRIGGTYCYGHHHLFLGVLRALGYRTYTAIARMNFGFFTGGEPNYAAYGHMVLLVQLGPGQAANPAHTWLVDIAPGPPAPIYPLALSADPENIVPGASEGERQRMTRGYSPQSSLIHAGGSGEAPYTPEEAVAVDDYHALWQVEYDSGPGSPRPGFGVIYQFGEQEFVNVDFMVHHYAKMYKPHEDVFSDDVVAFQYFLADEGEPGAEERFILDRPMAKHSLFRGIVKRRNGTKVLESFEVKSELERVQALKKYFGITVEEKDIVYMEGRDAAFAKLQKVPPELAALI